VHLADLLAALAVFGLIAAATFTTLQEGLRAYTIGAARAESQQSGRVALERLAGDLRLAGLGPQDATFAAISLAEPTHVVLHRDLDGDGAVTTSGETVTWRLTGRTLRRDAGGGAQPIIDGVRSFVLEYLDAAGAPTASASSVRTVMITLTTEAESVLAGREVTTTYSTRVRLRNR
jgi:type II secretory pathway component PulJ